MRSLLSHLADQLAAWTLPEIAAVILAILYLVLAIRQNIWCWLCAALSTAIYTWLFFSANLYMESALNVFYFVMAIYGWIVWSGGGKLANELPVCRWGARVHVRALAVIAITSVISGYLLALYTDAAYPYVDSATTVAAVWATFLVARKVLENWWYWLVIDAVSVYIFWARGLEMTSILFLLYVWMIPFGLWRWTAAYRGQGGPAPA